MFSDRNELVCDGNELSPLIGTPLCMTILIERNRIPRQVIRANRGEYRHLCANENRSYGSSALVGRENHAVGECVRLLIENVAHSLVWMNRNVFIRSLRTIRELSNFRYAPGF